MTGITGPILNPRFVINVPFKNRKTGKTTTTYLLNFDGHLDYAHQVGLVSLTAEIQREWETEIEGLTDENGNPKMVLAHWVRTKATVVVSNPKVPGGITTSTGINVSTDYWDNFVKGPKDLVAVSETRAMKRALYNACGITEAVINPQGKEATRESVDLQLHPGDEDEPDIPKEVRRPNITPPISSIIPRIGSETAGDGKDFGLF